MENQKKWAGWLIAGLVAAVGVVAVVMTTARQSLRQPPSPRRHRVAVGQPVPGGHAAHRIARGRRPHRQRQRHRLCRSVLVRLTLDDAGAISAIDVGGARFLETAGVGSGVREEAFTSQFIGKAPPFELNQDIDAVSGATLSSQAAVDAVNEAYAFLEAR